MKRLDIQLDPWKWSGMVITGGTPEEVKRYATRCHLSPDIGAHSHGHMYLEYGKGWMLWVKRKNDAPTLAHECLHLVTGIMEVRGVKFCAEIDEVWAYSLEWLMREILTSKQWKPIKP